MAIEDINLEKVMSLCSQSGHLAALWGVSASQGGVLFPKRDGRRVQPEYYILTTRL
jgi:hypothetical protein